MAAFSVTSGLEAATLCSAVEYHVLRFLPRRQPPMMHLVSSLRQFRHGMPCRSASHFTLRRRQVSHALPALRTAARDRLLGEFPARVSREGLMLAVVEVFQRDLERFKEDPESQIVVWGSPKCGEGPGAPRIAPAKHLYSRMAELQTGCFLCAGRSGSGLATLCTMAGRRARQ